jgi:hypothetical protein
MITAKEAAAGVYGAYRLALLDRLGLHYFDATVEGFWRSFYAAAIVAPGYAILVMLRLAEMPVQAGSMRVFLIESIAYVISWTAFPLAMFYVCQMIDRGDRFIRYIVAYNWSSVVQMAAFLPVATLAASGALPDPLGSVLTMLVTLAVLFYQWFIARTALEIPGPGAAGIVLLDIILSVIITGFADSMLRSA